VFHLETHGPYHNGNRIPQEYARRMVDFEICLACAAKHCKSNYCKYGCKLGTRSNNRAFPVSTHAPVRNVRGEINVGRLLNIAVSSNATLDYFHWT